MEFLEAIKSRKSIRGYSPSPVPRETLAQILETATHAPTACNSQPWEFLVLGGKVLDELKDALEEKFASEEEPHPDFGREPSLTGVYRRRQAELAKILFQAMHIARGDKDRRKQWMLKMARFFDAPNAIIITTDEEPSAPQLMFSLGTVSQTIALAAIDFGLGTCIEYATVFYPEVIRQILSITEFKKIAIGIAIGYPDWNFPANRFQSTREPLASVATWYGV